MCAAGRKHFPCFTSTPYDFEIGETNNQRLEPVFLEHTYRWLKPDGVLAFVIPQFSPDGHWGIPRTSPVAMRFTSVNSPPALLKVLGVLGASG
jgi:hypothetical protein